MNVKWLALKDKDMSKIVNANALVDILELIVDKEIVLQEIVEMEQLVQIVNVIVPI
jgi:hypothetical protein